MTHYKEQLLACDFFTIETLFLHTLYMLIFIEIGTRRVHFVGCTAHPDHAWVTQQARQVMWELADRESGIRFLIRGNDKKFTEVFDTVFRSEGINVIPPPFVHRIPTRSRRGGYAPRAKSPWTSCCTEGRACTSSTRLIYGA